MTNNETLDASKPTDLTDVQGLEDTRGIALNWVGIRNVAMPIQVMQKEGGTQHVKATCMLSVGLAKEHKGTHMSRFVEHLSQWRKDNVLTLNLKAYLKEMQKRLNAPSAQVELKFDYFMEKAAPATKQTAPMAYGCRLKGIISPTDEYQLVLGVTVPVTTLCPCSKQISKYGAHNQRSHIRATLIVDSGSEQPIVWLEDVIRDLELTASCPVFPLLKRPDEKWVTEEAFENPKFVEDVVRDATILLREKEGITGFHLEVEAFESIHDHNAWTEHHENFNLIE